MARIRRSVLSDAAGCLLPISYSPLRPRAYSFKNGRTELQGKVSPWHESDEFFYQMRLALCFLFLTAFSGLEIMTARMCKLSCRVKFPHGMKVRPGTFFHQMRLSLCFLFLNAFSFLEIMTAIMRKLSCRVKFPHGTNPTHFFIRCGWVSASYF